MTFSPASAGFIPKAVLTFLALFTVVTVGLCSRASAQLDRIHWLPPVMTNKDRISASNSDNHFVVITTPSFSPVNYTIRGGSGAVIQSGTVSNSSPINFQIANNVGNRIVPTVAGQASHHVGVADLNTVTLEGIVVEADEPVYVNIRQRSGSQGASMTSKGCAALGTDFRVGTMRNRLSRGQDVRTDFFSIMATEDNTVVTIDEIKPGMIFTGRTDTSPITVTLQQFESYTVGIFHPDYPGTADVNDIDGTRIRSDKAVTIVSGTYLGSPTSTGARDAGFDQPGPSARAGREHILFRGGGANGSALESPQVIATRPNTDIFINGSLTPINPTPLQPGDFLYLDGEFAANGTMFIESSEPVLVYQTTAGSNSSATPGFSFIPPLATDVTNLVDNIADIAQIGPATLRVVTTAGSNVTINGQTPANGPIAVAGTDEWVVFTQADVTGNVRVESTGPVAVSVINLQNPVGAAGYFSGFPLFRAQIEIVSTADCLPGLELLAIDPSGALINRFEWFNGDGTPTGVVGESFTPTVAGTYFVRSFLAANAPCPVEDSDIFTVIDCPVSDVQIVKTVPQDPVGPGSVVTFTLEVTNNGPDPAAEVSIEDILPAAYTYVANSITGGDVNSDASPSGSGLRWLIDELPFPGSATLTFQARLNASGPTENTATVTSDSIDDPQTNNTSSADIVPAVPEADSTKALETLTDNGDGTFTATFLTTVTNTGNEPLENIRISDPLTSFPNDFPSGTTGAILTSDFPASAWTGTTTPDQVAGNGTLAVGTSGSVRFTVTFTPDATAPYDNQATVTADGSLSGESLTSPTDDPSTAALDDPTQVVPNLQPGVALTKTLQNTLDNGDGSFTSNFAVLIENTGNDVLTGLALTEDISDFPGGTFTNSAVPVTLAVNDSITIDVAVTYTPDSVGPYTNLATIDATGNLSNSPVSDSDTAIVTPPLNSSISLTKTLTMLVDNGGGDFTATFTILAQNTGNELLSNITITDDLSGFPAGTTADFSGLATNVTIPVGGSITSTLTVPFSVDANAPYSNTANVLGQGQFTGDSVDATSTVPVQPTLTPAVEIIKTLGTTTDNGDGTFTSSFSLTVNNTGNEPLSNVSLSDDLGGFPPGATLGGTLSNNATLATGASLTENITVTFTPNGPGPFNNTASVTAVGTFSGGSTNDTSDAVPVTPLLDAAISTSKSLDGITDNGDGTFIANFTLTVTNTGNEPVQNIQIQDALSTGGNTFPSGTIGTSSENPSYNGTSNSNVLSGSDTLAVGADLTATVTATFTPDGSEPYSNTATATAQGSFSSSPESATSQAVPIDPPLAPSITLTKTLTNLTDNGDGTFSAEFALEATNDGNEALTNFQLTDSLASFSNIAALSVTTTTPENANYDGLTDTDLLSGSTDLPIGSSTQATISFTFTPDRVGPFENQASAVGTGAASGEPGTAASPVVPVNPILTPALTLTKDLQSTNDLGDGNFSATFLITATNSGNEPLTNVTLTDDISGFPAGATLTGTLTTGASLAVGANLSDTVTVEFIADANFPYTNSAAATSEGEFTGTAAPAAATRDVTPPFQSEVEIIKDVRRVTISGTTVSSEIEITVSNIGNEPLEALSVVDNLAAAPNNFPPASNASATVTSSDFAFNAAYTGQAPNIELLAANQTLAIGESGVINLTLTYEVVAGQSDYLNQATATGTGTFSGGMDTEISDNPDTPGADNDPSSNAPPFEPELDLEKAFTSTTTNADGTVTAVFTLTLENVGTEPVENIQITDDISASFPAGATLVATSTDFTIAQSGNTLLAADQDLVVNEIALVTATVTFTPDGPGPFANQASVTGTGVATGRSDFDLSDDPATSLADDPTAFSPAFTPSINVTKTAGAIVDNNDGTFTVPYTITVSNDGDEPLENLALTDPLTNFTDPLATLTTTDLTIDFDPATGRLLDGSDTLAVGETKSLVISVTFIPTTGGDIENTVIADATGAFSTAPATDNATALITPPIITSLVFEKALLDVIDNGDGTFTSQYDLTVENTGNEPLNSVQLTEDFANFPAGFSSTAISGDFTVTATSGALLSGTDSLPVGGSGSVAITVTFTPDGPGPFTNQASVDATGASSAIVLNQDSDDPTTPDAADDPTSAAIILTPSIAATKTLTSQSYLGAGQFQAVFDISVTNTGNEALQSFSIAEDLTGFPPGATFTGTLPTAGTLAVGETQDFAVTVTYTPNNNLAYQNEANVSVTGAASGTVVTADPTATVQPDLIPAVTISKSTLSTTDQGSGNFRTTFTLAVSNTGNEALNAIQVNDILTGFPANATALATSSDFTVNANTGDLLAATDSLAVGASGTITYVVDYTADGNFPYTNQATTTAIGAASGEGTNATSALVPVTPPFTTTFTLAKALLNIDDNGDGSFTANYNIVATNTGNEPLIDFQINEPLTNFPGTPAVAATSASFTASYDAATGNLLTGTDLLAIGATQSVSVSVTYTPVDGNAVTNTVTGSANGQNSAAPATATSNSPSALPTFTPALSLTKSLESNTVLPSGNIQATYSIVLTNSGTEPLSSVQAVDDLTAQVNGFPATVVATATSADLTIGTWDGVNNIDLLTGTDTLAVGQSGTITISLESPPVAGQNTFLNQATASGAGDFSGTPSPVVSSDDPTTGAPADATALNPDFFVDLNLEKTLVGAVADNLDGTFTATFDLTVLNVSNEAVDDVLITENLDGFPAGATLTILANPALFNTGISLPVAGDATGQVSVTYTPDDADPVVNRATATATGNVTNTEMTSVMTSAPAITPLTSTLTVEKTLTAPITDNGDGTFTAIYQITVANTSNQALESVQITDPLTNFPTERTVSVVSADLTTSTTPGSGDLLLGTDSLALNATGTIDLIVTFTPENGDPISNIATATALGDLDNAPATDDSDPVEVTPPLAPALTVAKTRAGPVLDLGAGLFRATYSLDIANTGNEELISLQVSDPLSDFPSGTTATATSSDFVIAADISSGDLLLGTENLAVGASGTITLVVDFAADENRPYDNIASGTARGQASREVITVVSGTVVTEPPLTQDFTLTKTTDLVTDNDDGTFTAAFTIDFANTSNEPLDLVLTDELGTFPLGSTAQIIGSTGVIVDTSYAGRTSPNLLAPTQLPLGGSGQVRIAVTYTPDSDTDYENQVDGTGTGAFSNVPVTRSATASVVTPLNVAITLVKTVTDNIDNGNGTFTGVFDLLVTNTGNQPLQDLQLVEDLTGFPSGTIDSATSDTFTIATDFADLSLLAGSDTLAVGASESVSVTITYTPDGVGPFQNQATVNALGQFDDQPATATGQAELSPALQPEISLTKTTIDVLDNSDGTFTASFEIEVENTGNEPLTGLAITDDLSDFPADRTSDLTALPASLILAVGATETYPITVTFTPDGEQPFTNSATVTGSGEFTTIPVTATDTDDANPALITSAELDKTLGSLTDNSDGTFTAAFTLTLRNTGNEILRDVQVSDDISTTFPAGSTLIVTGTSSNLTPQLVNANLLVGSDAIAVNGQGSIDLSITFTPDGNQPYLNSATLTATGNASDTPITVTSDDPATGGDDATVVTPVLTPDLTVTKDLTSVTSNADGSFLAIFEITAENSGNELLDGVQIIDDLATFPNLLTISNSPIGLTPNPDFGLADPNLLTGTDSLAVGATASVTLEVTFIPDSAGPFANTAVVNASGNASSTDVTDTDNAAVAPPFDPQIEISKDVKTVSVASDGSGQITSVIDLLVRNVGNEPLVAVQVADALNITPNNFQDLVSATVTSADFTIGTYDGLANPDMLDGTDTLAVGEAGLIELTIIYRQTAGQSTYLNQATATGIGEFSTLSDTEISDNPDTPGAVNDPSENAPPFEPELEVTKQLLDIVDNGSGSFTANFLINVTSTGTETVANVQVTEDLSGFPAGATALATSTDFAVVANEGDLLDGTALLPVGASGSVNYAVTFTADGNDPYSNQASASGVGLSTGDPDFDLSDDPDTLDPEDATQVNPIFDSMVTFEKSVTTFVDNNDGTFTATYTFALENIGNEPVANLQLADPLTDFPADTTATLISTTLTANSTAYSGSTQPNLLTGTDTLPIGATAEAIIAVTFTPADASSLTNTATLTAVGGFGGDPVSIEDDAIVTPTLTPSLTVTKTFQTVTDNNDGTFTATFEIIAENDGNEALDGLQLTESLTSFPADTTLTATSTTLSIAPDTSTGALLTGADVLLVGQSESVTVTLTFTPDGTGPFTNSVTAQAIARASTTAVDSTDTAPVTPPLAPALSLTKDLVDVADNTNGTFTANFTITIENTGNEALRDLAITDDASDFPAGSVLDDSTLPSALTLAVGASETYNVSVLFTPDGQQPYSNSTSVNALGAASNQTVTGTDTAPADPVLVPSSSVVKSLTQLTDLGDGNFRGSYQIVVANTGNEVLTNLTVIDDLSGFPAGASLGGDPLPVNATFAVGQTETFNVTVDFAADSAGPFQNTATVTATGGAGGGPGNSDSGAPIEASPPFAPQISLTKTAQPLIDNGDGTFTTAFTIAIENIGNEPLASVQITDDLSQFANAAALVTSEDLSVSYDASVGTLLTGNDRLAINATAEVEIEVTFTPDRTGPFTNFASVASSGSFSTLPATANDQAEVTPLITPAVEISKDVRTVTVDGNGIVTSTIELLVRNVGNETLTGVQITDDLQLAPNNFPATALATVTSDDFTVAAYDGITNIEMLTGADTLAPLEAGIVTLTISFDPNDAPAGQAAFRNQAIASGNGELSADPITEISDNPDTPGVDNDPSDSAPPFEPELEITKALDDIVDLGGGRFQANFTIRVTNTGNETVSNISLIDDISTTFPAGSTATAQSGDFIIDGAYDGLNSALVVDATGSLIVGQSGDVTLMVSFTPDENAPYFNSASVSGIGAQSGFPDFDGSDDPTTSDPEDATEVDPTFTNGIMVTKVLDGPVIDNAVGTFTANFIITVANTGNQPLASVQVLDDLSDFPADRIATATSAGLSIGPDPNTGTLLTGTDTLAINESQTVNVAVTFTPDGQQPYGNSASATALGEFDDLPVDDDSGLPVLADPPLNTEVRFEKAFSVIEDLGAGDFRATYQFTLTNTGNEAIVNAQIIDTLADFPAGTTGVITAGDFVPGQTVAVGQSVTQTLEVTFTADENAPYENQATFTGTGAASGLDLVILSDDPDTPAVTDPTIVNPPFAPALAVDKVSNGITDLDDGQFEASFTITVANTGNEPLSELVVLDDLSDFPVGATANITGTSIFSANPDYDGTNALVTAGALEIGQSGSVTLAVTFTPDADRAYGNSASASGEGRFSGLPASGATLIPATVTPEFRQEVRFEKALTGITDLLNGSFRADFTLFVENLGNEALTGIALTDPLTGFPAGAVLTGDTLPTALSLAISESASFQISVTFTPDSALASTNQARLTGQGGTSNDPLVADSDDPDTLAPGDPTRVSPPFNQSVTVAKSLVSTDSLGDDRFQATYLISATNTGNQPLNNLQIIDDLSDFDDASVILNSFELATSFNAATGALLAGTDTLEVGETKSLTIEVTFTRTRTGSYLNSASVTGDGRFDRLPAGDDTDVPVPFTPGNQKAETYQDFLSDFGVSGNNDDGDLYGTAFEFATCLDPTTGDHKDAFCLEYNETTNRFEASYLRRIGSLAGVTYTLEGLDDLRDSPAGWAPLNLPETVTASPSNLFDSELVTFENITANFVRLKIEVEGITQFSQVFGQTSVDLPAECQTFSDPFVEKECYSGTVTGQSANTVQLSSDLPALEGELYVEFLSGTYEGHRFEVSETASSGDQLVLEIAAALNTLDPIPADLDGMIAIRNHRTLESLAPPSFFAADDDPTVGDDETRAIVFMDGSFVNFFVDDTTPPQWTDLGDSSGADAGGLIIDPCMGIFLHSMSGPVTVPTAGVVRQWQVACPLEEGYQLIGSVYPLAESPNERDMLNGFTGSNGPGNSDQLHFWNGDLGTGMTDYQSHFYARGGSLDQWVTQANSSLDSENDDRLFETNRAVFYDMVNPQQWIRPLTWTPQN